MHTKKFGQLSVIIKTLKSTLYFDSKALSILLEGMLPKQKNNDIVKNFIKEFNRIVFTYCRFDQKQTYAIHQEIWTKPRSSQQLTDTQKFNSIFSIYLEDLKKSALARLGGYFYHPISRRVAIRKQPNVKVSTLLKNYISFEHDKKRRDDKRSLSYRFNIKNIWRFGGTFDFINDRVSSCVGFATRLLGSTPIVASFANLFSRTGLMIQTDEEKAQEDKGIRNFIKTSFNHLHFGHAKEKGNVRKQDLKKLTHYAEGCGVIYDPTLKKSFAIGFGAMREHIWSCVVTDGNGILLPRNQWKPGWVCADKVSASSMSSEMVVKMLDLQENKEDLTDPRHKDAEHVTLKHPYDPKKYAVPKRPDPGSIAYLALAFKNNQSFMLGSHLAELRDGKIYWNGHEFDSKDYKGHPILIPNAKMYDWLEQRRILKINVDRYPNKIKETVIFGTASDHYPLYPDLLGFMARRNISKKTNTWIQKKEKYADRQGRLNPDRAHLLGQQSFFMPPGYHPSFLQNRSDEICEKCGLQIKHAPRKIMLNRFVRTHDDFIYAYLSGSQGVPKGTLLESDDIHRPRPAHITDHELYRAFGGKHRDEILGHLHFADVDLVFDAPSKANQICYHPLRLLYHRQFGLKNDEAYVSPLNLD